MIRQLDLGVRSALLHIPTDDGRRWVEFDHPEDSIVAWEQHEVLPALARVESVRAQGKWAVGMVSYDAGPAFDQAIASQRHERVPLVAFGVFGPGRPSRGPAGGTFEAGEWVPERTDQAYESDFDTIKELIAGGQTYQVNYTMRLRARFHGDPLGLFEALCRAQRADHMCFLDLGEAAICSASPELFYTRSGSTITTRPMKGTRPRHPDPAQDELLIRDLQTSEKDRAENTMIVS